MQEQNPGSTEADIEKLFESIASSEEEQGEETPTLVQKEHNKWVQKTLALIRQDAKEIDPALGRSALQFCDRVQTTYPLHKKDTLLLRFIYLRKFDKTGLAGSIHEEVFKNSCTHKIPAWLFPKALRAAQDYRKRKSGLAALPIKLMIASLEMAEYYDGENLAAFVPQSFIDGNEFVMWFSEHVMYLKKKKKLKNHKRFASQSRHSDLSENSEDDMFFNSSTDDDSEATYHSVAGGQTSGLLSQDNCLDLSEDSAASSGDEGQSLKLSVCRGKWEKAKKQYEEGMREFNMHILKYPLFRGLVKSHFQEVGFRVNFQDKQMRCHEMNSQGAVVNHTVENAWPVPQEYNLCSHQNNVISNPFQALQLPKQPQLRSVVRMAVYPDERLSANIKNRTVLTRRKTKK